jgi:hypothetical protein
MLLANLEGVYKYRVVKMIALHIISLHKLTDQLNHFPGSSNATKCYGNLGCLHLNDDWFGLNRPVNVLPLGEKLLQSLLFFYLKNTWLRYLVWLLKFLNFKMLYFLKMCPIFAGSLNDFCRSNDYIEKTMVSTRPFTYSALNAWVVSLLVFI